MGAREARTQAHPAGGRRKAAAARTRRRGARLGLEHLEARTLLATGLVAAYDFGAGAGATVLDASGNGNTGTISSAVWTTSGKYGNALSFNGTNAKVVIPDSNSLHLTTAMTLEAWVRPTALSDWASAVIKERPGGLAYALYATDGATRPPSGYIDVGGSDLSAVGAKVLSLNAWSHLAATYDGAAMKLYVNGVLVKTQAMTGTIIASTKVLDIGGNSVWGEYFAGLIDEVRVYNRALSASEVQTDMNTPINSVPDTTPPTVSLTAPANNATVSATATLTATASDNVGVVGVQFLLNNVPLGAEVTASPYMLAWDTTTAANGTDTIAARARDAAGNVTTSTARTVTVSNIPDTTPPTVALTAPADGATVSGTKTVTATAADNVGVVGVQFKLDGTNLGSEVKASPYSVSWNTVGVVNGSHVLTAVARDAAGNSTTSATVTVSVSNVDATPPTVSLTAPANNATVSATATLTATASDNVGVVGVQFLLNNVPLGAEVTASPYTLAWDTTTSANGTDTIAARARDAAGNVTTSASRTVTVSNSISTDPAQVGQWSSVMSWPLVAINAVLLDTGNVLLWDGGPDCIGAISATVWSPATNTFTPAPSETQQEVRDIFCSAQTVLADGRVLVAGGHACNDPNYVGSAISEIFDPATQTWTHGPDMAYRRWYPTLITRPDGKALVIAGADTSVDSYIPIPEIYDPVANTWAKLSGANQTIPDYPFAFNLPDGRVLVAGSDEAKMASYVLNVATQTWSVVDPTVLDAGSAVMYAPGKIMKAGSSYLSPPTDNGGNVPSSAKTYVLDMTQATPAWQQTASMAYPRTHLNLTLLPGGNVLATGGSTVIGGIDPATGVLPAEMWNPVTRVWTTMSSMAKARMYHSTALLLPDGRVLEAGSGHNYANSYAEYSAEIYSPPYLFKGARPTITSSPGTQAYGQSFFVGTPDAAGIASVSLIRDGSVTHSFNMDQQVVPLTFRVVSGGLMVDAPADANTAAPGYYMLFIVNANGVPSIAPLVHLPAAYQDNQPPTAPAAPAAAPASVSSIALTWTAATDNVGVTGYDVYRSTTQGFTPSAANRIGQAAGLSYTDAGLAGGTYYYQITAHDAAGNVGPPSGEVNATVTGDVTPPTVAVTAPANGVTLTGTATVTAAASDNVGVAGVQFLLDGVNLGAEETAAPYSFVWSTASVANGPHTLTAAARDASGNRAVSPVVAVTVANAPTGLVGAWGFEEGTGTTAGDVSGHGLNGTLANATWAASGKFGKALSFDGSSAWVTVADNALLHLTTGMTLEAWVKPAAAAADWSAAVLKERPGGLAYALYAADGANKPPAGYIDLGGSDVEAAGTSVLPLNTWSYLAASYDGAMIRLFVNGVLAGSQAQTGPIIASNSPLRFGGDSVWGEYFSGLIDEVRIYSRALSTAEIQVDMTTPVGGGSGALAAAGGPGDGRAEGSIPGPAGPAATKTLLTADALPPLVDEAIHRWAGLGASPGQLAVLRGVSVTVADFAGAQLGFTSGRRIWIDRDAAGYGWFVDPTPADDSEFRPGGPAAGAMDLLTVLVHEMGHALGYGHSAVAGDVMHETLPTGVRRIALDPEDVLEPSPGGPGVVEARFIADPIPNVDRRIDAALPIGFDASRMAPPGGADEVARSPRSTNLRDPRGWLGRRSFLPLLAPSYRERVRTIRQGAAPAEVVLPG